MTGRIPNTVDGAKSTGDAKGSGRRKRKKWAVVAAFVCGGALSTILDLPEKIGSFWGAVTGRTPVERVLHVENQRSLAEELVLVLAEVNPQALVDLKSTQAVVQLTVNQSHLRRFEKLASTAGFEAVAVLSIDRTTTIMNNVGLAWCINDLDASGQLTQVDIRLLRPLP